ncbi:hypothetical protein Tco_1196447, partial [Tanacetum coccineum]
LQALVDRKKIVITKSTVRRDLQLEDAEGVDCLSNATIFEQLTLIGYEKLSQKLTFYKAFFYPQWKFLIHTVLQCLSAKTTAWNEFSSTMASAIICLAANQKFNFSKYIFKSMVKNLDNAGKFLMYPRQGKDFSGRVTPLFPTIVVQAQEEMGEGSEMPTDPHHTPIITQPSSSQPQRKQKSRRRPKEKDTEITQSSVPSDPTNIADEAVTKERKNTKTAQAKEITSLKKRVKRLENKGGSRTHKLKRLYKIGRSARVVSSEEASLVSTADPVTTTSELVTIANVKVSTASPTAATITNVELTLAQTMAELKSAKPKTKGVVMQEPSESITTTTTILSRDKGKGIMVEEPLKMKKKDQINFDEQEAIRLQAEFDEEVRLLTIEERAKLFQQLLEKRRKFFAAKRAEEKRNKPPTKAQQRSIMTTYLKNMAGWKPKDLKNKSFANVQELFEKAMKRVNTFVDMDTKLVEGTEGTPDEEEVAIDAIPLATKPPNIVDWKIIKEGKIGYYHKLRADGNSKRIKRLLDDLRVTAAQLMLLVYKLLLLVLKVNVASTKVTTAQRLRLLKEFLLSEKG